MAKEKKAGSAAAKAPAGEGAGSAGTVEFVPREVVLVDDKVVDDVVVRKIERTIVRELVDGEVQETVVSEIYVHGLYTVNCPRDSDPKGMKRVTVSILGTHPDGSPFQYHASIQRGVNVPNLPYCAVESLQTAIETRYSAEEKNDRSGFEMKKESSPAYPVSVIEGPYWTRKK